MKKLIALAVLLCLCLCGCAPEPAAPTYSFEDLTIQIPEDYNNLSDEEFAQGLSFVFGLDPIAINGMREPKSTFEAYGLTLDLEKYGRFLQMTNDVSAEITKKDGVLYFTYASGEFTYVVSLWETQEAYWTVQAYCPTADYSTAEADIWDILKSVKV